MTAIHLIASIAALPPLIILGAIVFDDLLILGSFIFSKFSKEAAGNIEPVLQNYALIISAHNEENVIASLINSIRKQNYPESRYNIFVVADNCTDNTASVLEKMGVSVFVRNDTSQIGKGYALNFLLEKISAYRETFDAFIILDADIVLNPAFLSEMNAVFTKGYDAVQGTSFTKNSDDSSCSYMADFSNQCLSVVQQGRYYLGHSALVIGNCFGISRNALSGLNWKVCFKINTEEEIKCLLINNGNKIGYSQKAVIYEESLNTMHELSGQRSRWFKHYLLSIKEYSLPLLKTAFTKLSFRCFEETVAHLYCTSNTVILIGLFTNIIFQFILYLAIHNIYFVYSAVFLIILKGLHIFLLFLSVPGGIRNIVHVARKFPFLLIGWIGGILRGICTIRSSMWYHSKHNRNITIEEKIAD